MEPKLKDLYYGYIMDFCRDDEMIEIGCKENNSGDEKNSSSNDDLVDM